MNQNAQERNDEQPNSNVIKKFAVIPSGKIKAC